jgi:DNA polymerase I
MTRAKHRAGSFRAPRSRIKLPDPADPATRWTDLRAAVREAAALGARFCVFGDTVEITPSDLPAELLARLPANLLADYLGAARLDQVEIDFLATLQTEVVLVENAAFTDFALADLEGADPIAADIETSPPDYRPVPVRVNQDGAVSASQPRPDMPGGTCPHRADIQCLSLYAGPRNGADRVYVIRGPALVQLLRGDWLARQHLVCHNTAFELAFVRHHTGFAPAMPVEDSMQACGLLHGAENRGLDDASRQVLALTPPKQKRMTLSAWNAPRLSQGQTCYAATDVVLTLLCWEDLEARLKAFGHWDAYCLQRDAVPIAAAMQVRGLPINLDKHRGITEGWARELADLRHAYRDLTGEAPPSKPAELRAWVLANAGPRLAQWPRTAGGELSVRFKHLKRLILAADPHVQAQVRLLLRLTTLTHLLQNFGPSLSKHVVPSTGRLHTSYSIARAKTGRLAAANPPLQQLPQKKAPAFKSCIEIDRPGYVLIGADYSQVELRAMAHIYQNEALTEVFAQGLDIHAVTAARLLGIPESEVTPAQRDLAKPANYGSVYGISPRGLVENALADYDLDLSEAEAAKQLDNFFSTFPGLRSALEQRAREFQYQGYIEIGCGRVIRAEWEVETRGHLTDQLCFNAPTQGICADLMMRALIRVHARLAGLDAGIVATVHDEIVAEAREDQAETVKEIIETAMLEAFELTFPGAPTRDVVEATIGKTWAELKA